MERKIRKIGALYYTKRVKKKAYERIEALEICEFESIESRRYSTESAAHTNVT